MKLSQIFLTLIIFPHFSIAQSFTLPSPDSEKIVHQMHSEESMDETIYIYLLQNFTSKKPQENKQYYEWDHDHLCAFTPDFDKGVCYSLFQCKEAGGITVTVRFPHVEKEKLIRWVEQIHAVDKQPSDTNVWKDDFSKYEPEEPEPGCYYTIWEEGGKSWVKLHCGC